MSVKFPQYDKPPGLSGGADAWDNDLGGVILTADYFESAAASQTLTVPLVSNESTFYTYTVTLGSVALVVPLLTNNQAFYGITLTGGSVLEVPFFENQNTFYSAHISGGGGDAATTGGFWEKEYSKMLEWVYRKKPELQEVVQELPAEVEVKVEKAIAKEIEKNHQEIDLNSIRANLELQKAIIRTITAIVQKAKADAVEDHNRRYLLLM